MNAHLLGTPNTGKTILVTGAGGCIGSAHVQSLASRNDQFLILLDHSEQNLHEINLQLAAAGKSSCTAILGDILDGPLMTEVFKRYGPHTIYHAAAFKHVPLMESNPIAVVRNNALGTWELAKTALRFGAERLLLISTDKAVNPHSIMGVSKRVAELALLRLSMTPTRMNAVRFGNVLGSQGSVGPLFQRQIQSGAPLTVTHPEASRYFLTLSETVELIVLAAGLNDSGSIFIPKMCEPVKILDLAKRMVREAGLETPPGYRDCPHGLAPGRQTGGKACLRKRSSAAYKGRAPLPCRRPVLRRASFGRFAPRHIRKCPGAKYHRDDECALQARSGVPADRDAPRALESLARLKMT